jgi:alpha-glucosidase
MRDWYAKGHAHFLEDGVDYWWNDEGETEWFTYLYWNMAQQQQWDQSKPNQRHFTINRAFQPGMQRFPAITWSGDGQDCSHAMILRQTMYGQPYTACDMTSPDATVLVRQYQNAVFMPIMRVHQMHGTPRFPFLWGGAEHHAAFRDALNMRYAFLPFLYSLAHHAHQYGRPIGHPARVSCFMLPLTACFFRCAAHACGGRSMLLLCLATRARAC